MKNFKFAALCALALTATPLGSFAHAQDKKDEVKPKPAPITIRFNAHSMHANDFQVRRSRDRILELKIKQQGLDRTYTEWMQRDHPYIFAEECIKQTAEIAKEFKSTSHMLEFDKLIEKRGDLRIQADKYGHDVAFAEWLRTEHPNLYLEHFGVKPGKKSAKDEKKHDKDDKKPANDEKKPEKDDKG